MLDHDQNQSRRRPEITVAEALALPELNGKPAQDATPILDSAALSADGVPNPLHQIRARLSVCVGSVELSVGELLAAKARQVMCLDRRLDEPVDLVVEGHVVARGVLVAVGDQFGVMISELPRALKL
jgi:flagellar motor switch protein FliN/FliY